MVIAATAAASSRSCWSHRPSGRSRSAGSWGGCRTELVGRGRPCGRAHARRPRGQRRELRLRRLPAAARHDDRGDGLHRRAGGPARDRAARARAAARGAPACGRGHAGRPACRQRRTGRRADSPGRARFYVEDLVDGPRRGLERPARFPAASTLKVAIAVEALRAHVGKPEPGSYLDSLLRRDAGRLRQRTPPTRSSRHSAAAAASTSSSAGSGSTTPGWAAATCTGRRAARRSRRASRASPRSAAASTRLRSTSRACSPTSTSPPVGKGPLIGGTAPRSRRPTPATCSTCSSTSRPRQARPVHRRWAVHARAQGRLDPWRRGTTPASSTGRAASSSPP